MILDINRGFLPLKRKTLLNDTRFMRKPFDESRAWLFLLIVANYKDGFVKIKGIEIPLQRAQLAYSLKHLSGIWEWNIKRVRRFLNKLENENKVSYKKFPKKGFTITTIITILDYGEYTPVLIRDTENVEKRDTVRTQIYSREMAKKKSQRDTVEIEDRDTDNNTIPIKEQDNIYHNIKDDKEIHNIIPENIDTSTLKGRLQKIIVENDFNYLSKSTKANQFNEEEGR